MKPAVIGDMTATAPIRGDHRALPRAVFDMLKMMASSLRDPRATSVSEAAETSSATNHYPSYRAGSSTGKLGCPDRSKAMVTSAIAPHALSTISSSRSISCKPTQISIARRAFSTNGKPQDVKSGSKLDMIMSKLDSIDNKVTATAELYKKVDEKVDRCIDKCERLSEDVQKLQEEQKGSGDWTSIKVYGKNINVLAVGRALADLYNKFFHNRK